MKERQRWRPEEDALLRAYVKQYGARDWHLVSDRMNHPLNRDAKSCLERWKNYLKPGIKKGSLTEDEQRLVIRLQAKHGNKWKKIAAEVPGRTAKRLGKWWEVFKEKQLRQQHKDNTKNNVEPIDDTKYDHILETFAEKLVRDHIVPMPASNAGYSPPLPPWLASTGATSTVRPPSSPSVTLTLSPLTAVPQAPPPPIPWLQPPQVERLSDNSMMSNLHSSSATAVSELVECCKELEEGQRALAAHKKEAAWRLKRVELQLESEKANRRREKMEEIEAKVKALREEEKASLERIESEYREQLAGLRRDAEAKEQKLAEQWATKHVRLTKFLEQIGCRSAAAEANGR